MDDETRQAIESLRREIAGLYQLGQGVTVNGDLTVTGEVDIRAGRFWALDEAGNPRMIMSASNLSNEFGINAHLAGFNENGVPQFWFSADDGAGTWGGGDMRADNTGLHAQGLRRAFDQTASNGTGTERQGTIEMFPSLEPGVGGPAWRLRYEDTTPTTELVQNGTFDSDVSGWSTILIGESSFMWLALSMLGSPGLARLHGDPSGGLAIARSAPIAITVGERYRVSMRARCQPAPSFPVFANVRVEWYNSSDALLSSTTIYSRSSNAIIDTPIDGTVTAPAGAVTARVYLNTGHGNDLYVDDVSMQKAVFSNEIVFDDNGLSYLKWVSGTTSGVTQDNVTTESYTDISCPVRVLADAVKIEALFWGIRTSGNYEVRLTWDDNRSNSIKTIWSGSAPGSSEVSMVLPTPLILLRGVHYLTLVRTSGAGVMYGKTSAAYTINGDMRVDRASFDGTQSSTRVAPVRFGYRRGEFRG